MSTDISSDRPWSELSLSERLERMETMGDPQAQPLLDTIKAQLPALETLLSEVSSEWHAEDGFYRFYHQSFKVYHLQHDTERIANMLRSLMPDRPLNKWFEQIIGEGTGRKFEMENNERWLAETRPILEAFFHAKTILEFTVKYGRELASAPISMPSGWAALLCLYKLR